MRGLLLGLIVGGLLIGYGYEKGVLAVGSPGKVNWEVLQSVMPVKIDLAHNQS